MTKPLWCEPPKTDLKNLEPIYLNLFEVTFRDPYSWAQAFAANFESVSDCVHSFQINRDTKEIMMVFEQNEEFNSGYHLAELLDTARPVLGDIEAVIYRKDGKTLTRLFLKNLIMTQVILPEHSYAECAIAQLVIVCNYDALKTI
jgi:hypothetical protein